MSGHFVQIWLLLELPSMIHQGMLSWSQVAELMPAPPPPHPSYLRLPNESPSSGLYFCARLLRMRVVALNLNMGPWTTSRFKFLWSAIRKLLWLFTFPSQLKPFFFLFFTFYVVCFDMHVFWCALMSNEPPLVAVYVAPLCAFACLVSVMPTIRSQAH